MLDDIKARRITKLIEKNACNQSGGSLTESETEKKHRTPEFVQHCVTAITDEPKTLDRIRQRKDGSPFAICWAKYKQNKRSLAAKHSKGEHHTVKEYESALKKLRSEAEEIRNSRPSRSRIVFENVNSPRGLQRSLVIFRPQE